MYDRILQILQKSDIISDPRIIELNVYGERQFRVKIRGKVEEGLTFQVWLNHRPWRIRYSYQLFKREEPILRWDNAPHHPELAENFPHHFHDALGKITASRLSGSPLEDVLIVLQEIGRFLGESRDDFGEASWLGVS
jgi:hypothetical protein